MTYTSEYPIIGVCADAVVFKHGHVLLVERKDNSKWALPGGHLDVGDDFETCALRELAEETGVILRSTKPWRFRLFDDPRRSKDGQRKITVAYCWKLGSFGRLPIVKAGDDAARAFWCNFAEVYENEAKFHDDHYSIIQGFINYDQA